MADGCGHISDVTVHRADPDCGCTAEGVAHATPIQVAGPPVDPPGQCDPNIAADVVGRVLYVWTNGAWVPFVDVFTLDLCTLPQAAAILPTDMIAGCFNGQTASVPVSELQNYIIDLCSLPDLTGNVQAGNTKFAACVAGETGIVTPADALCNSIPPSATPLSDGDHVIACTARGPELRPYTAPCDAPLVGNLEDGDVILSCDGETQQRKTYVIPPDTAPCDAPLVGNLEDGDVVLSCDGETQQRKTYVIPPAGCDLPNGGELLPDDKVLICRGPEGNQDEMRATIPPGAGPHATTHISGGSDEIDGDLLDVDFSPGNCEEGEPGYTPDGSATEAGGNADALAAHLQGIANEICWARQNLVRWTAVESPSEDFDNHNVWNIYVDMAGNDLTGDGTAAAPFQTVQRAIISLSQYRIIRATAMINVAAGTYPAQSQITFNHPDSVNIRVVGAGAASTILNFSGHGAIAVGTPGGSVENITIRGDGTNKKGVYLARSTSMVLRDCIVENFGDLFGCVSSSHNSTLDLYSCEVRNNLGTGIAASNGGDVNLYSSNIHDNSRFGIYAQDGGVVRVEAGNVVTGNTLADFSPSPNADGNYNSFIHVI